MATAICECGHEKRDHRPPRPRVGHYGQCKVCLCNAYVIAARAANSHAFTLKISTPAIEWILERLAFKCCPQGINVMAEELQWLGLEAMTQEKLTVAIHGEMKKPHPRVQRISEGVYWFSEENPPAGWSLYSDVRMLPCFYRRYPPSISWEDLDSADNILPRPENHGQGSAK